MTHPLPQHTLPFMPWPGQLLHLIESDLNPYTSSSCSAHKYVAGLGWEVNRWTSTVTATPPPPQPPQKKYAQSACLNYGECGRGTRTTNSGAKYTACLVGGWCLSHRFQLAQRCLDVHSVAGVASPYQKTRYVLASSEPRPCSLGGLCTSERGTTWTVFILAAVS